MSQLYYLQQFWMLQLDYHLAIFILPCLEYDHLLYYGAANTHLSHLGSLQQHAASIYYTTFPLLSSHRQVAAISLICRLLAGEGRGNLQTFCPHFATCTTRRSSRLSVFDDSAKDYRITITGNFWSLDRFYIVGAINT